MQNVSSRRRYPSNILPEMLNCLQPLTPSIPISEGSCNKNQATIGDHLVFSPANSQTQNHIIPLLIVNYYLSMQPSNISAIFAKVEHFNFGQITTLVTAISRVSAPISEFNVQILFSEFNVQILYLPGLKNVVADFLSRPNQTTAGSVATTSAEDPVDFEEMAAEQNCCPKTQRLLGGTSLKLAFRQTGAQHLTRCFHRQFSPNCSLKFRKNIFDHFHNVAHPRRLASSHIISSRFVWRSLSSDVTAWAHGCLACQWGKIHRHTRLVPSPSPSRNAFFSSTC
jgi:hypothetical protein